MTCGNELQRGPMYRQSSSSIWLAHMISPRCRHEQYPLIAATWRVGWTFEIPARPSPQGGEWSPCRDSSDAGGHGVAVEPSTSFQRVEHLWPLAGLIALLGTRAVGEMGRAGARGQIRRIFVHHCGQIRRRHLAPTRRVPAADWTGGRRIPLASDPPGPRS